MDPVGEPEKFCLEWEWAYNFVYTLLGYSKNIYKMILMDIGAVIFLAALMGLVTTLIKDRHEGKLTIYGILSLIGGLMMIIAYYIVMGNESVFSKIL